MRSRELDCSSAQSHLENAWVDSPRLLVPESDDALSAHLDSCARCRGLNDEFQRVDASLTHSFDALAQLVSDPRSDQFEELLRRIRETTPEARLRRRLRRAVRVVLWGAFYALTLLACTALAVTLARVLAGR